MRPTTSPWPWCAPPGAERAAAGAARSVLPDEEENSDLYANVELVSGQLTAVSGQASVVTGLPRVVSLFRGESVTPVVSGAVQEMIEFADSIFGLFRSEQAV